MNAHNLLQINRINTKITSVRMKRKVQSKVFKSRFVKKKSNNLSTSLRRTSTYVLYFGVQGHPVEITNKHAVDTLPVCVENLVVNIYRFFHIYTVRVFKL